MLEIFLLQLEKKRKAKTILMKLQTSQTTPLASLCETQICKNAESKLKQTECIQVLVSYIRNQRILTTPRLLCAVRFF